MSRESRIANIFIIVKCTAPNLSFKIRYNFLGHPVYSIILFSSQLKHDNYAAMGYLNNSKGKSKSYMIHVVDSIKPSGMNQKY